MYRCEVIARCSGIYAMDNNRVSEPLATVMKVRRDLINSITLFQVIVQFVVGAAGVSMCEHWLSLRHNCN